MHIHRHTHIYIYACIHTHAPCPHTCCAREHGSTPRAAHTQARAPLHPPEPAGQHPHTATHSHTFLMRPELVKHKPMPCVRLARCWLCLLAGGTVFPALCHSQFVSLQIPSKTSGQELPSAVEAKILGLQSQCLERADATWALGELLQSLGKPSPNSPPGRYNVTNSYPRTVLEAKHSARCPHVDKGWKPCFLKLLSCSAGLVFSPT